MLLRLDGDAAIRDDEEGLAASGMIDLTQRFDVARCGRAGGAHHTVIACLSDSLDMLVGSTDPASG